MSTITTFVDNQVTHEDLIGRVQTVSNTLDFSKTNVATSDVVQAIKIPAGAVVHAVYELVVILEGATCTATVGDASGANSWDASFNLNAANGTMISSTPGTDAYANNSKYYESADTIDLTMANNAANGTVKIMAQYSFFQ